MAHTVTDRRSRIRRVISEFSGIAVPDESLKDSDNLFDLGMSSQGGVSLMTGIEVEFDVELPDELIRPETFSSVNSIDTALEACLGD